MPFTRPPNSIYYSYHIARGEQGVLTFEPYKSLLLPLWRFRTEPIAITSSQSLWQEFLSFYANEDFVGMDMARKFIQMGMTRAKRYANHKGGRKYEKTASGERGKEIEKSKGHEGMEEKERASQVFREVWEKCKAHEGYEELKERFLKEQREWVEMEGKAVKSEALEEDETNTDRKPRKKIKTENST